MPPRTRKPRPNPLIPVDDKPFASSDVAGAPEPMLIDSPICDQHWPDGWASLGDGDYASCEHGEWSKTEHFVKVAEGELTINGARRAQGLPEFPFNLIDGPTTLNGVTTDGIPVTITLRPGELALVALATPSPSGAVARAAATTDPEHYWPERPAETVVERLSASPFAPKLAEIEPEELDAGEDVMFMPSGG